MPFPRDVCTTNTFDKVNRRASNTRPPRPPSLSRSSLVLRHRFNRGRVSAHPQGSEISRDVLDQVGWGDWREGPAPGCRRKGGPRGTASTHSLLVGKPSGWVGLGWVRRESHVRERGGAVIR